MEDTHIVQMYWDRNDSDQRVCDEIWYILYVHCTEYSAESGGCRRMCQRHLASRVERYAAAPAVSVIHISWKNNEKSFV